MAAREARHRDDVGLTLLVGSFLLAPFAWLLDLQISYAAVKWACENEARTLLLLLPLATLAVLGVNTTVAWSCWRKLRDAGRGDGGHALDPGYFLALSALAMNGIFALLVLTSLAPRYFLSPCE